MLLDFNLGDKIIAWIDQNVWFVGVVVLAAIVLYVILRIVGVIGAHGSAGAGFSGDGVYRNSPGAAYRNEAPTTRANSSSISTTRK